MIRILSSIWFLALIVAVPLIIYLPPVFDKYKIELISKDLRNGLSTNMYFKDLNDDGKVERIDSYHASNNLFSFQCFTEENRLIEQYNFPHFYHQVLSRLFFNDTDKDGLTEVFGFTTYQDSVFMSWGQVFCQLNYVIHRLQV